MSRIWRYVLASDNGMAPCAEGGLFSLSCCKPMIRRYAREGDWVVGFVPKSVRLGHIAWAGKVAKKIRLGAYEKRFRGRSDAIYRLTRTTDGGEEVLEALRDDYHPDEVSQSRDRKGKFALIFNPFWYWGGVGFQAPDEISDLAHYFVGQSVKNSSPEKVALLEAWLRSVAEPGKHGDPRDKRLTRLEKPVSRQPC